MGANWRQLRLLDNATEMDLSETRVAGYSGVEDVGGSFYLVRAKAKSRDALTTVAWGDLIDHLSGVDGTIARYDTPSMRGLGGWAKWGMSGDLWEVALAYGDPAPLEDVEDLEDLEDDDEAPPPQPPLIKGFRTAAAISFYGRSNQGDFPDTEAVSGSVSLLHEASGLNLTVAGGQRFFPKATRLNDGALGTPQDAFFYYIKPGLILDVVDAGHTAFYGEYGSWHDFLGAAADKEAVAGLVGFRRGPGLRARQSLPRVWKSGEHLRLRGRAAYQRRRDERLSQLSAFSGGRRCRRQSRRQGALTRPQRFHHRHGRRRDRLLAGLIRRRAPALFSAC